MKEETFKEYVWRGKELEKVLRSVGVEGDIESIFSDYGGHSGLYLHVKTKMGSEDK